MDPSILRGPRDGDDQQRVATMMTGSRRRAMRSLRASIATPFDRERSSPSQVDHAAGRRFQALRALPIIRAMLSADDFNYCARCRRPAPDPDPDDILGPFWTLPADDSGPLQGWACAGCLTVGERPYIAGLGNWAREWLAER